MKKGLKDDVRSYMEFPEYYRMIEKLKRVKYGSCIDFKTLKPAKEEQGWTMEKSTSSKLVVR